MKIMAVNPWIHDFAAADYWMKPYGFLVLLSYLKKYGHEIEYIDLLNNYISTLDYGRQIFYSEEIEKPPAIRHVPRKFKRYGVFPEQFKNIIESSDPDIIIITSTMTYWYTGLLEAYEILKMHFPSKKIYIGGNYPTLMKSHFRHVFRDALPVYSYNLAEFFQAISSPFDKKEFFSTLPHFTDFYKDPLYAVLRTTWGCIDKCPYCAVNKLFRGFFDINNEDIIRFIDFHIEKGINNFAFYDDALLFKIKRDNSLLKYLSGIKPKLNFHTPNAMHLRFIDREIACLMNKAGFIMPRFGLETTDAVLQSEWGGKVNYDIMSQTAANLQSAGYKPGEFSVYILLGFPGQNLDLLPEEVRKLNKMGYKVFLSEFSPVPGTLMADQYYLSDPLLANNSIFNKDYQSIWSLKNQISNMQNNYFNSISR